MAVAITTNPARNQATQRRRQPMASRMPPPSSMRIASTLAASPIGMPMRLKYAEVVAKCVIFQMPETMNSAERSRRPTNTLISRLCLRVDEDESDAAVRLAAVFPGVVGRLLHQHVARAQVHFAIGEKHVDLAFDHHRVIDAARAVHLAL